MFACCLLGNKKVNTIMMFIFHTIFFILNSLMYAILYVNVYARYLHVIPTIKIFSIISYIASHARYISYSYIYWQTCRNFCTLFRIEFVLLSTFRKKISESHYSLFSRIKNNVLEINSVFFCLNILNKCNLQNNKKKTYKN